MGVGEKEREMVVVGVEVGGTVVSLRGCQGTQTAQGSTIRRSDTNLVTTA